MDDPRIRVGVKASIGQWAVSYFVVAREEAMRALDGREDLYHHIADQFKELSLQDDPTHSDTVDVRKLKNEGFYELRDKGGPLGKINFRAFYIVDPEARTLVVLGAIKKESDKRTPMGDIVTMRRRFRDYLAKVAKERKGGVNP